VFLFRIARTSLGRMFIGWVFAHMSFVIPVERLRETRSLVAFYHPRPSYPIHILLVPKKAIGSLTALTDGDQDFVHDLFLAVQSLVAELGLEQAGYRLIANGGKYQEVTQLHSHVQ
jgi:histidine triad (HIT) family protein